MSAGQKQWVIYDELNQGWAYYSRLEGWIFTRLEKDATRFNSKVEAMARRQESYGHTKTRLVIKEVEESS